jgi:hypothetical protein
MKTALKSLLHTLKSAAIVDQPWPHCVLDCVFPEEFYLRMLSHLPTNMQRFNQHRSFYWLDYGPAVRPSGVMKRPIVTDFWDEFRATMLDELWMALEDKFAVVGRDMGSAIVQDIPGYELGPHTDTPDKLMTGTFYLPETDEDVDCGTVLYRGSKPDSAGSSHRLGPEFEEIVTIPYVPNSALFFVRTDWTYHGVNPTQVDRWSLVVDLFS